MLAVKARGARASDRDDIVHLAALTGAVSVEAIERLVASIFPGERLLDRSRKVIEDFLAES